MNDDQFKKMLHDFDTNAEHATQQRAQRESESAALLEKFLTHAKNEIEPVLTAVGHRVREHGHDYGIRYPGSAITFEFFPKTAARSDFRDENTPHITFAWATLSRKVHVHGSNISPRAGGTGGPQGDFDLAAVTSDFVRERVMKLVQEVLAKQPAI